MKKMVPFINLLFKMLSLSVLVLPDGQTFKSKEFHLASRSAKELGNRLYSILLRVVLMEAKLKSKKSTSNFIGESNRWLATLEHQCNSVVLAVGPLLLSRFSGILIL